MTRLETVFEEVTHSSDKWQPYFEIYERHLSGLNPNHLVEVGVQKGGSLEMWGNYFPTTKITGIDIDRECSNLRYDNSNISVIIGDQGNSDFWDEFLLNKDDIDIFIDDGGHYMNQQILTFEKVFPKLRMGGVYLCEDCHTSYMWHNGGGLLRPRTFIEYSKSLLDIIHFDWTEGKTPEMNNMREITDGLTSIHFYDSVVVFEKFGRRNMNRVFPKQFR